MAGQANEGPAIDPEAFGFHYLINICFAGRRESEGEFGIGRHRLSGSIDQFASSPTEIDPGMPRKQPQPSSLLVCLARKRFPERT